MIRIRSLLPEFGGTIPTLDEIAARHQREAAELAARRKASQDRQAAHRRLPRPADEGKRDWTGHAE